MRGDSFIAMVAAEGNSDSMSKKLGTDETHSLHDESDEDLAQEIGLNAYEYLEECFYNEVSVLDRDKFNAIPEIVKSDLTILVSVQKYRWRRDQTPATNPLTFRIAVTVHR